MHTKSLFWKSQQDYHCIRLSCYLSTSSGGLTETILDESLFFPNVVLLHGRKSYQTKSSFLHGVIGRKAKFNIIGRISALGGS